jgi:hypothetical protein
MNTLMYLQTALITERLTTIIIGIRTLAAMYIFMSLQVSLSSERFIAHINIRMLLTMNALMFL